MIVTICQIVAVCSLIFFTIIEIGDMYQQSNTLDSYNSVLWTIRAIRISNSKRSIYRKLLTLRGTRREVGLCEDRYLAGNRLRDDLYLDAGGRRVRLYINVQSERLLLTVLQGEIRINQHKYTADKGVRIEISDWTRVEIQDMEIEFVRKRGM